MKWNRLRRYTLAFPKCKIRLTKRRKRNEKKTKRKRIEFIDWFCSFFPLFHALDFASCALIHCYYFSPASSTFDFFGGEVWCIIFLIFTVDQTHLIYEKNFHTSKCIFFTKLDLWKYTHQGNKKLRRKKEINKHTLAKTRWILI